MRVRTMAVFVIGAVMGLGWLASPWFHAVSAFSEEEHIGIHLAAGEGFLSPFDDRAVAPPTSWSPPVYPAVVGIIYHFMGVRSRAAVFAIIVFNLLCRAAAGSAIYRLGNRARPPGVGVMAAAVFLLTPNFLLQTQYCWDNSLSLAGFLWLLEWAAEGRVVVVGIGTGVLLLTNASYGLAAVVAVGIAARGEWRRFGVAAALLLVMLLPWTVRNYATFGRLFFVRGNIYTELWLGNQPLGSGWMTSSAMQWHPSENAESRREVLALGEMKYSDLCRRRFWQEYHAAPEAFWRTCLQRLGFVFVGRGSEISLAIAIVGVAGALITWRGGLLAALAAAVPYIPTQVDDRYVMPTRALLIVLASAAVWRVITSLTARRCKQKAPAEARPATRMRCQSPTTLIF